MAASSWLSRQHDDHGAPRGEQDVPDGVRHGVAEHRKLALGFIVAVTPHVAALLFGRYVLKMNPVILFGACSGAGTVTAALRAIQDEAGSKMPVLGYTVPYAIGNILLTAWGPVIVMLTR